MMISAAFMVFAIYSATPVPPSTAPPPSPPSALSTPARPVRETEVRQHYRIVSRIPDDEFALTEIRWLAEAKDKHVVLIESHDGAKYLYRWEWDYEHQVTTVEFGEVGSDSNIRLTSWKPYAARTRAATIAEAKKNSAMMNADYRFEVAVGKDTIVSGLDSFWKDVPTARQWRSLLRQAVSPLFLERMEILDSTGLFALPVLGGLRVNLAQALLYRTSCDPPEALVETNAPPDCRFDKSFGFACSEKQEARAKLASETKPSKTAEY